MITVVIPCYKVSNHILGVLDKIGQEVDRIFVVDDLCPEKTGGLVKHKCTDQRVKVLFNNTNLGVGGATIRGINEALSESSEIIIKVDGDGQMDPGLIPTLIEPLLNAQADFTKGNRFHQPEYWRSMPKARLLGNSGLSFISKLSSGYWSLMDPTNGFFAIHETVAREISWEKLSPRYFFESDLLYHLSLSRAVIKSIPMPCHYGDEKSNLSLWKALLEFPFLHSNRFAKRLFYNYILRDLNPGSLMLINTITFLPFGLLFGTWKWYLSIKTGELASAGTVMLSVLPIVIGYQSLLSFLHIDIENEPSEPIQKKPPTASIGSRVDNPSKRN